MKPHVQGSLDSLCAVYTIVNAARIVSGIDEKQTKKLFQRIINYLDRSSDLSRVLIEGVGLTIIGGILRDVVDDRIPERRMPFKHHPDIPLDEFWKEMTEFLEVGGRRAILTCLGGPAWDHWSIVRSISDRQICFFDSHRLRRLYRSRCTTTRSTSARPHLLCPTHTYFLS